MGDPDRKADYYQKVDEFFRAAVRGDTVTVLDLLRLGIDPNTQTPGGSYALLMASRNGDIETMRVLLEHGEVPNPGGSRGYTALTHAIHRSLRPHPDRPGVTDAEPLRLLREAGARPNLIDAVLLNDVELVRAFLDAGGDVNEGEDSYNGPLLQEAAEIGHVEMVDFLLARGANIEATDDICQRPLMVAAARGQFDVVKLLLDRGAEIDAGYESNMSALSTAAMNGYRDVAELLIARALDGVFDALILGDANLAMVLLVEEIRARAWDDEDDKTVRPSDVNMINHWGTRVAMQAVRGGEREIVEFILDHGAVHLEKWRDQHSLLAEASKQGHDDLVRLLIDRGADLDAIGKDGLTALEWATREGREDIAVLLKNAREGR